MTDRKKVDGESEFSRAGLVNQKGVDNHRDVGLGWTMPLSTSFETIVVKNSF